MKEKIGPPIGGRKAALLGVLLGIVLVAFLCAQPSWAADRDVEWGCYQNSPENNGVTSVAMPGSYEEAALKWGKQLVEGYTVSFTPPLIIDGTLYTASNKHVYKINKQTGEVVKESQELKLNVSYAMNPITYDKDNDQIYVPILKGRVACLDAETLDLNWTSKEYQYTQSLSPITYKDGGVYTGIWKKEMEDGVFFRLDAETGEEVWTFKPSEHGDLPHGFYWAGAYVNDKYVVVGSDDGSDNTFGEAGAFPPQAIAYCFDRETGEVVDRITNVKGDIRSSVVYHNGYVYFVSKGGCLYKAALSDQGKFSNVSFLQLKDVYNIGDKDTMMTSTPVVHGGRIYVGAAGSGGQFSADGGHMFAVVKDDTSLLESSLIYTTRISGYPQAAPILSTAEGKTRLYFTFNAFPGGIYMLDDRQDATAANHPEAALLYRPETEMQQYCISPLCCDREGTIYFKNDSGRMMAVAINKAWLDHISVTCSDQEVGWDTAFTAGTLNYNLKVPDDATSMDVRLTVPSGMTAKVNGQPYTGKVSIPVREEAEPIIVTVSKTLGDKEYTRTYTLNATQVSNNAELAGMVINASNTKPGNIVGEGSNNNGVGYDPQFDPSIKEYVSKTYDGTKTFLNLWLQAADPNAKIQVWPVANVGNSSSQMMSDDGFIEGKDGRYPVYWVKGEQSAEVDVKMISESGKASKIYHVTLVRTKEHLDVGAEPMIATPSSLALTTRGKDRSGSLTMTYKNEDVTSQCTFSSTDVSVATVDDQGNVYAAAEGEAVIWVTNKALSRRIRVPVTVSKPKAEKPLFSLVSGTYTRPMQLSLSPASEGTEIRYMIGVDGEDVPVPATDSGTEYTAPILLGAEPGETHTYEICAIAWSRTQEYLKSEPQRYTYTIDRSGQDPGSGDIPPNPPEVQEVKAEKEQLPAFPNGATVEEILKEIRAIKATVKDTDGNTYQTNVEWDTENLPYDLNELGQSRFLIHGTAQVPEGVVAGGNTMHVAVKVQVTEGVVEAPEMNPAPGTYRQPLKVKLKSRTEGAGIAYTISGISGTQIYSEPLSIEGEAGKKVSVQLKAYAARGGVKSKTVSAVYVIDLTPAEPKIEITAPEAPTIQQTAVNASGKKITVDLSQVSNAASYLVEYRENGKGAWKKATGGTRITLSGLKKQGLYQLRGAAVNAAGQSRYSTSAYCFMAKTSLKVKAGKKSLKVTSKKVKGAKGYWYRYGQKSTMAGAKYLKAKKPKATLKKLKSKKKYYVQAAPVKEFGGHVYIGQWIKKSAKVK